MTARALDSTCVRRHTAHPVDGILATQHQVGKGVRLLIFFGFGLGTALAFVLTAAATAPLLPGILQVGFRVAAERIEVRLAGLGILKLLVLQYCISK